MTAIRFRNSLAALCMLAFIVLVPAHISFALSYAPNYQLYWCNGYYSYSPCMQQYSYTPYHYYPQYSYYYPQYYSSYSYYSPYAYSYPYYGYSNYYGYSGNYNYNVNYNGNVGYW
jgi:hypothetical protein